jgi:hypothetical protein
VEVKHSASPAAPQRILVLSLKVSSKITANLCQPAISEPLAILCFGPANEASKRDVYYSPAFSEGQPSSCLVLSTGRGASSRSGPGSGSGARCCSTPHPSAAQRAAHLARRKGHPGLVPAAEGAEGRFGRGAARGRGIIPAPGGSTRTRPPLQSIRLTRAQSGADRTHPFQPPPSGPTAQRRTFLTPPSSRSNAPTPAPPQRPSQLTSSSPC